jgi:hypothetical protein
MRSAPGKKWNNEKMEKNAYLLDRLPFGVKLHTLGGEMVLAAGLLLPGLSISTIPYQSVFDFQSLTTLLRPAGEAFHVQNFGLLSSPLYRRSVALVHGHESA